MEHESFEDTAIADRLNRDFVSIKVDREERPDVDRVYMSFVQATTGSGGWPMTVFLTHDLKPFFGGTYFPPASRWGRPGFADLLGELARVWKDERPRVEGAADGTAAAAPLGDRRRRARRIGGRAGRRARHRGRAVSDGIRSPARRLWRRAQVSASVRAAVPPSGTRPAIRAGRPVAGAAPDGGRDPPGDGARRHARSRRRRLSSLLRGRRVAGAALREDAVRPGAAGAGVPRSRPGHRRELLRRRRRRHARLRPARHDATRRAASTRRRTPTACRRNRPAPKGRTNRKGRSTSGPTRKSARSSARTPAIARIRFGIEPGGNAPQDPQGEFTGKNLLYTRAVDRRGRRPERPQRGRRGGGARADSLDAVRRARAASASASGRQDSDRLERLDDRGVRARGARARRPSIGGRATSPRPRVRRALSGPRSGRTIALLRRYRDGEAAIDAYAEDYAYLIWGLLELFQADGNAEWLEWALSLQTKQDETFWDPDEGGWFSTSGQDPTVLLRLKEDYDGAEPSASSVAALNTLTIAHLTGDTAMVERARADPRPIRTAHRRRGAHDPDDAERALRMARGIRAGRHRRSDRRRAGPPAGNRAPLPSVCDCDSRSLPGRRRTP